MLQSIGPVVVPIPGTPIRVTSTVTLNAGGVRNDPTRFSCHAALLQARYNNTGKIYIGTQTLNRATLEGVIAVLAIPTVSAIPSFSVALTIAPSGVDLSNLWIDADVANEGILLSILVT